MEVEPRSQHASIHPWRRSFYAPAAARSRVLALKGEINNLLSQRADLVKNLGASGVDPQYASLAAYEENVLMDIRDLALEEFVDFHVQARRLLGFQQSLFV